MYCMYVYELLYVLHFDTTDVFHVPQRPDMVQTLTQQATRKGSSEYATGMWCVCMHQHTMVCVCVRVCVCISTYVQYVWVHVCICICTYVHMCAMCSGSLIYDCYIALIYCTLQR